MMRRYAGRTVSGQQRRPAPGARPTALTALTALVTGLAIAALPPVASAEHSVVTKLSEGNGAFHANFAGSSADGQRTFFVTDEALTAGDVDTTADVYESAGAILTLVSAGWANIPAAFGGSSADGSRVWFETRESLVADDVNTTQDVYEASGGTLQLLTLGDAGFVGASADGTRVFFVTDDQLVSGDQDSEFDVYQAASGSITLLTGGAWFGGPAQFQGSSADGTRVWFTSSEAITPADQDSMRDVYQALGGAITLLSGNAIELTPASDVSFMRASEDGSRVFFISAERLTVGDTDGSFDTFEASSGGITLLTPGTATDAVIRGASADGARAFFETESQLVAADVDPTKDVYQSFGGVTTLMSGGSGSMAATFVGSSSDGARVFFDTFEGLVAGDTNGDGDVYQAAGGVITRITPDAGSPEFLDASADGSRVFFRAFARLVATDTDNAPDIYETSSGVVSLVSAGTNNGFEIIPQFKDATADGGRVTFETMERISALDSDNAIDVYQASITAGPGDTTPPTTSVALSPASPNGGNGWYRSGVTVSVSAIDADSGVAETRCALDPLTAPAQFGSLPPECTYLGGGSLVNADGTHTLHAASVDVAGNEESPVSASFGLDATPPTVTCQSPAPVFTQGATGAQVSATVTDGTSGPAASPVSVAASTLAIGSFTTSLVGLDLAGNSRSVNCSYEVVAAQSCNGLVPTIVGTAGDDIIRGTQGVDVILGLEGHDVIDARRGDDVVCSGAGNDDVIGGAGRDFVDAGDGTDLVDGGADPDQVYGSAGDDDLSGGRGDDFLDGGAGVDILRGSAGTDTCVNGETTSSCP